MEYKTIGDDKEYKPCFDCMFFKTIGTQSKGLIKKMNYCIHPKVLKGKPEVFNNDIQGALIPEGTKVPDWCPYNNLEKLRDERNRIDKIITKIVKIIIETRLIYAKYETTNKEIEEVEEYFKNQEVWLKELERVQNVNRRKKVLQKDKLFMNILKMIKKIIEEEEKIKC